MDLHVAYGGVVPEIAAREHIRSIHPVIEQALADAQMGWDDIDAIAVTYGAGLGGSLLVGVLSARTLALIKQKPLYAINHVEGHVYASFLTKTSLPSYVLPATLPPSYVGADCRGGHSQLVLFRDHFDYTLLGQTHDDAIGEAFDKVAK
jgi:N6-L-threonylcarbamoyladenine synthase